ncbi:MAG: hypothetical protein HYT47_00895 [Candidatus Vogelbacteria bacterium]|nr:hypothetical protein [Candidatus Vogelbacteria bacterium]
MFQQADIGPRYVVSRLARAMTYKNVLAGIPFGGVISSYAEHRGFSIEKMFRLVTEKITASVQTVLGEASKTGQSPRAAAVKLAARRLGR